MNRFRRSLLAILPVLVAAHAIGTPPAAAQTWPTRPVKFYVPLGPGSGIDIGARLYADRLSTRFGQPVVVENRPGGDGLVAISAFVGANDDHVLLCSPVSAFSAHPYLHKSLPYKPSDLQPIFRISNTIISYAVPASLEAKTMTDFVAMVRAKPGEMNWAGVTGANDFLFEAFAKTEKLTITKVPYRNPVEAANDVGAGRVQMTLGAFAIVQPHIQAGRIKVLALTSSVRTPAAPEIPTAREAGFPDLTFDGLNGCFGKADMPLALRQRIAEDFKAVSSDPIIADRLTITGQIPNPGDPIEFGESVDAQRAKLAELAKTLGIKPAE